MGGRLTPTPALSRLPRPDVVVAADSGAKHAAVLGIKVDVWVGDFDSATGTETDAPREVHPAAKDETDGELAIRIARERGANELIIIGAFGGRFDHTAALVLGGVRLAQEGLQVTLTSGDEWGWPLLPGTPLYLDLPAGTTLSVVACSELRGLNLSGTRWPLQEADIPLGSGWTLSNEVTGPVQVQLQEGYGVVVALEVSN